jgi:hypothetical protein
MSRSQPLHAYNIDYATDGTQRQHARPPGQEQWSAPDKSGHIEQPVERCFTHA